MQFAAIQGESGGVRGGGGDGDGGSGGSGGSSGGGGTESDASSDNTIWYAQARD
jgi:CitMHS family citrate-Mg2+:H+ or citrate-Ca2+:H+ symporter|tara:strand:+ start:1236 stop:1397 length:162 start_codon:yes stop_codon:yes gene_type:complete